MANWSTPAASAWRYISELAPIAAPTRDSPPFTVRQLLTQSSGLPFDDSWGVVSFATTEDELRRILRAGITFGDVPGASYGYSNLGFALLGRVLERAAGIPFRDYVTAQFLRPLHMNATVWRSQDVASARLAIGYRRDGERLVPEPRPPYLAFDPAGGLYSKPAQTKGSLSIAVKSKATEPRFSFCPSEEWAS